MSRLTESAYIYVCQIACKFAKSNHRNQLVNSTSFSPISQTATTTVQKPRHTADISSLISPWKIIVQWEEFDLQRGLEN